MTLTHSDMAATIKIALFAVIIYDEGYCSRGRGWRI